MTADRVPSRVEADGAGGLTYQGSRYLLVRPETLVALQKAVEAVLGERAAACLAAGGRAGGGTALQALEGAAEEIVARLLAVGGEMDMEFGPGFFGCGRDCTGTSLYFALDIAGGIEFNF